MEGTGFLTIMPPVPPLPLRRPEGPWLDEADLRVYADEFAHSGFFGPVSYYRNLDANFDLIKDFGPDASRCRASSSAAPTTPCT